METVNEALSTDGVNERLSPGGPGPEGQPDTASESLSGGQAAEPTVEPPAHSAVKAEWVDYAVSRGADRDDAEAATKAELVEAYG